MSPSSRRAWIEISSIRVDQSFRLVALLAEGVDRNIVDWVMSNKSYVALLAEGVDRNFVLHLMLHLALHVALLAEGVDRNHL